MCIFLCPTCGNIIQGFNPNSYQCGYTVPVVDGVYQFTKDKPISTQSNELKWLGYEDVGINYEPAYALSQDDNGFGIFGSCARKLAEIIGKENIVFDLGAGLGQASIPLAMAGVQTIAADISQTMMSATVKRANKYNISNFVCVRMNAYDLKLADSSIDAIIEIDMLHQVDNPELVIKEIQRVLKNDGILVKYGSKGFEYTDEQNIENAKYNEALKDIQSFYENIVGAYQNIPFSSWDKATNCIRNEFTEPIVFESTEKVSVIWNLRMGLHKTMTRASGSKQLIPDDIHNIAWQKTEEYAAGKYGQNYNDISRSYNMIGNVAIYHKRTN